MKISVATSSDSDLTAGYMSIGSSVGQVGTVRSMIPSNALVGLEPRPRERLLHDPPVQQVLLPVEQHQAASEERADEVLPPGHRSDLALVLEHLLTASGPITIATLVPKARIQKTSPYFSCITGKEFQPSGSSPRLRTTGRPSSPMIGFRSLPGGGSASATGAMPMSAGGRQQPVAGEVEQRRLLHEGSLPVARASYDDRSGLSSASMKHTRSAPIFLPIHWPMPNGISRVTFLLR